MDQQIHLPPRLHFLHGPTATLLGISLTYGAGLLAAVLAGLVLFESGLEIWQALLVSILFFDVAAGAVANFTSATNRHYQTSTKQRAIFLAVHLLFPLALALILGDFWLFAIVLAVFTVVSGFVIQLFHKVEDQLTLAAFLAVVGLSVMGLFSYVPMYLSIFGALFIIKIVLGFAVRRPDLREDEAVNAAPVQPAVPAPVSEPSVAPVVAPNPFAPPVETPAPTPAPESPAPSSPPTSDDPR
ncbi:hypothetical protein JNJ66_07500 [Candidatus Saccharibacteria bacterium]|nr:hypothetical protein [Candidatus Saccharibacteria bacterium]